MNRDTWNPDQYHRYQNERSQPFFELMELLHLVEHPRIIDLGCGPGELTRTLHDHMRAVETIGVDSSDAMLEKAAPHAGAGLSFKKADIRDLAAGEKYDIVFSNAALQWIDDHKSLIPRVSELVAPGGQLAIQIPANADHPTHRVAFGLAQESPYAEAMGGYARPWPVLEPDEYSKILHQLGYQQQHVRLQVFAHVLGSAEDAIEWVKGSYLTDIQKRMPAELYEKFLAEYRTRILKVLGPEKPFLYPFKRILFWGRKAI